MIPITNLNNVLGMQKVNESMMMRVAVITLLCLLSITTTQTRQGALSRPEAPQGGDQYQITPFQSSSGMYFEYIGEVRRSVSNWRIVVFLDVGKQCRFFDDLKQRLRKLSAQCGPGEEWCLDLMESYQWEDRWEMASELQEQFRVQIEELENTRRTSPRRMASQLRARRAVPLLGFLGKIAGPIIGVMTYNDGERYDAAIRTLNEAQANLSHLVGKQTHIVRSQLDSLHAQVQRHGSLLQHLQEQLQTLAAQNLVKMKAEMERRNLTFAIARALRLGLDHSIQATSTMLEAVHEARKGQLHPGLITSAQLEPILREVQDNLKDVKFPLTGPRISVDELMHISTVTIHCENQQLNVLIDIPLLEKYNYQAFKLHSLPTTQELLENGTGRAYVNSKYDYLIIDEDQRTYLPLKEQDWDQCKSTTSFHACLQGAPIYDFQQRVSCEASLLIKPTTEALRFCEVRITSKQESYWKPLNSIGGWIYSFAAPETATIVCHSLSPVKIELRNAGIIKLGPGCSLKAKDTIIPATTAQAGESEFILESELHLNLTTLSPLLARYGHLLKGITFAANPRSGKEPELSTFEANSRTLDDLEQQLQELSLQHHLGGEHRTLVYGSYGGLVLLSMILMLYICRVPCQSGIAKFSRMWLVRTKSESFELPVSTLEKPSPPVRQQEKEEPVYKEIAPPPTKQGETTMRIEKASTSGISTNLREKKLATFEESQQRKIR
ncbi:uncharacterized protein LOC122499712 [Leptopilina heterotoma]|uniref:uncharacterized protein LOC122499712 n=1 Tax=Leptopilina heterotoma TaxID=63436 RepID=UPI001CA7F869|nr:uncharacterized protein LOC122499712 [Leptopilina heterotoma]